MGLGVLAPVVVQFVRAWLKAQTRRLEQADAAQAAESVEKLGPAIKGEDKMRMAQSYLRGPLSDRPEPEQRATIEEVLPRVRERMNSVKK